MQARVYAGSGEKSVVVGAGTKYLGDCSLPSRFLDQLLPPS